MQSAKSIKETLKTSSQAVATDKVSSQPPLSRGKACGRSRNYGFANASYKNGMQRSFKLVTR